MAGSREHLYEVDLLRASIILGVVCVHSMSFMNMLTMPFSHANITYEALLAAFHFTREAFMFITGLVLFYTYYHGPFSTLAFWRKRFQLILIPYIAWTVIYILFEGTYLRHFSWHWSHVAQVIGNSLLFGQQFFLYYILVSIQLYLLFPLLLRFMRWAERWHIPILIASFLLELVFMWINQVYLQDLNLSGLPRALQLLIIYRDRNIITYQFWFVAGGVACLHYDSLTQFLRNRPAYVYTIYTAMLVILWAHFYWQRIVMRESEDMAVLVLQPLMVPYSIAVVFLLLRTGLQWKSHRTQASWRQASRLIELIAKASFGVLFNPSTGFALH